MTDTSVRRTYYAFQFVALGGGSLAENKPVIDAALASISPPLSVPVNETRLALGGGALIVEWQELPSAADVLQVDALIPAIVGVATTSAPIEVEALAVVDNATTVLVDVIDVTTPPRDAGTYQIMWASLIAMLAVVANAGVRVVITLTRSNGDGSGPVSRSWESNWDRQQPLAFTGGITFQVLAGQRLRARLQFARIGVAATGRLSQARITIDQIAKAGE